ncbi:MAG TPA: aminotransferase class I/II-fold pyridoxal phosphate-dependent enzyme [Isosphaeraceae bacterium]
MPSALPSGQAHDRLSQKGPRDMTSMVHGGDLEGVRTRLGLGDRPLLDFSVSFNPLGPPPAALAAARKALDQIVHYPQPGTPRLAERIAEAHRVPVDRVIVGAGTTELIGLVAQSLREVLALHARELGDPAMPLSHLVEPTYTEYRRVSRRNDLRLETWNKHALGWEQDFLPRSAAGIFWTGHPNNPTGRAWDRDRLLGLVDDTQGLLTVVDEAYLPFLPDEDERTVTTAVADRDNLLVLRSLTKIFSFPGLRVGYAVASADMVERLTQFQDPWSVSQPAEAAALAALDDDEYLERTRELIATEAARLTDHLWDLPGIRPAWPERQRPASAPPVPNYVLVSLTETRWTSMQVFEALARRGILVRECSDIPGLEIGSLLTGPGQLVASRGHLRFAVRTRAENDQLLAALREVLMTSNGKLG